MRPVRRRLLLLVTAFALILIWSWTRLLMNSTRTTSHVDEPSVDEQFMIWLMGGLTYLWFFALGGCVGSFINVVAIRSKLSTSFLFESSRCPKCQTKLRLQDNLPVVGWLLLRGKCRDCQSPIPFRYLFVEIVTGLCFLVFAVSHLHTGGTNLPNRFPYIHAGLVWIVWYTKWDLIRIYIVHCLVVSMMILATLLANDRVAISWRTIGVSILALLGISLSYHVTLVPISAIPYSPEPIIPMSIAQRALAWIVGVAIGAVVAKGVAFIDRGLSSSNVLWVCMLMGTILGWQTLLVILAGSLALSRLLRLIMPNSTPEYIFLSTLTTMSVLVMSTWEPLLNFTR